MNYQSITKSTDPFLPIIALENIMSHTTRLMLKKVFFVLSTLLFILSSGIVVPFSSQVTGFFFLTFCIFLLFVFLDAFYYSYIFDKSEELYAFDLAQIISVTPENDFIGGFIRSSIGRKILLRSGISNEELKNFLLSRKTFVSPQTIVFANEPSPIVSYIKTLFEVDLPFQHLLVLHGLTIDAFLDCALWVLQMEVASRLKNRWWSRDYLETIPSLGRDWAYGKAHTLMQMSSSLRFSNRQSEELHDVELARMETSLARSGDSNVLLVGSEGVGKMEIVEGLARKMLRRQSFPSLFEKHFFVLDSVRITNRATDARTFELLILTIFSEAVSAGNTIVVIPDMAGLITLGQSLGVNFSEIMGRFFTSTSIHIIAIADTDAFHRHVEGDRDLTRHFDVIMVTEEGAHEILLMLLDTINNLEEREDVLFTYPALLEVVSSSEHYFPEEPLFDRAQDLLTESSSFSRGNGSRVVTREDVKAVVLGKTGVSSAEIEEPERELLSNLETLLHERVVGQNEAVQSISDALRRARIGVNNPNRPVGSFLFLGPTGVGKTETAKALSEIFFGHKVELLRLDMSEYSSADSMSRLIGAFDAETPGVLSSMIREHGYGVLLLDEFEKTNSHVLDLFLQILDEGIFSDALGRKVNARNLIIIATSNAGSEYIFDVVKEGSNLMEKRDDIVSRIIHDGFFKPELLNRFDGVILFHPLGDEHMKSVAKTMLDRLAWRLKEKGITLVINDVILNFLISHGRDPKFGARALNRVIQDTVEKKIADRMISGQYKAGSTIEFTSADFS